MGGTPLCRSIQLRETIPGHCPVCRGNWTADPECHCDCTRAQPNDDAQAAAAYRKSAAHRTAKLKADALEAERTTAPIQRQHGQSNVVPISQASGRMRGTRVNA